MRALLVGFLSAASVVALSASFNQLPSGERNVCSDLSSLSLPNTKVTAASEVAAGAFAPPGGASGGAAFAKLPAFCRVAATLTPSQRLRHQDRSLAAVERLERQAAGGRQRRVGRARSATRRWPRLSRAATRRPPPTPATSAAARASRMGHPEKLIDFAYRSEHEMTVAAKAIIDAFYGSAPKYSYWNGCSAGGRQALKEAQMYPADFDGIIAGSPGLDWSGRTAQAIRIAQALQQPEARLSTDQRVRPARGRDLSCDANDGVKDGLIANPAACQFDPKVLACKGARRRRVPDARTGRDRAHDLLAARRAEDEA